MARDEEILKVLASETRREILKCLSEAKRTPSDLSRILKKQKSTIVEHLEKLVEVGLVERTQKTGEKFVYYSLTDEGRSMVSRRSKNLVIVLGIFILVIIGLVIFFKQIELIISPPIPESGLLKSQESNNKLRNYSYLLIILIALFLGLWWYRIRKWCKK